MTEGERLGRRIVKTIGLVLSLLVLVSVGLWLFAIVHMVVGAPRRV